MPVVDGLPVPVGGRQVPPRTPGARRPQHPVDHRPMIRPTTTPTRCRVRQQRLHPGPLLVAQIMPIMHTRCLPHPSPEIRGTRPRVSRRKLTCLVSYDFVMANPGPSAVDVVLSDEDRAELVRRAAVAAPRAATRAQIVLAAAEGCSNAEGARRVGSSVVSVGKWR